MNQPRSAFIALLSVVALAACVPPRRFAQPSAHVEDFDADRGLRALRHERSLDFEWTNLRNQQIGRVRIPFLRSRPGSSSEAECNGVLVAPDLVLTAAHCLKGTAYLSGAGSCRETTRPRRTGVGFVDFDDQFIQDEFGPIPLDSPADFEPSRFRRMVRSVAIQEIAAIGNTNDILEYIVGVGCTTPDDQRQHDAVLLRLTESLPERGFARIRTASPAEGQLLPVIHNVGIAQQTVTAIRSLSRPGTGFVGAILAEQIPELNAFDVPPVQCGTSGAPLFDEEGYIIGVTAAGDLGSPGSCTMPGMADLIFANAQSVFALPEMSIVTPASETSGYALGSFPASPFDEFQLERTSFGPRAELPRAVGERASGQLGPRFVTAGYATNTLGQHVFSLVGYESDRRVDPSFGSGGSIQHDVPNSSNEEIVDLALELHGSELSPVSAVNLSADDELGVPDSMGVARFRDDGSLDNTFGLTSPGLTRIVPSFTSNGSSAAAIAVDVDQSIIVAGNASTNVRGEDGSSRGYHESPVVVRITPQGRFDNRCTSSPDARPGAFIWRPEGTATIANAENLEQLTDVFVAPTYDMVVTDVALDAQSGIVLAGYLHAGLGHGRQAWIGRLNPDCTPDQTFGGSTTGVRVLSQEEFGLFTTNPDNAWFSSIAIDTDSGRIYVGGTLTRFDEQRGFFAGEMFVISLRSDGSFDPPIVGGFFAGTVIQRTAWHEETHAISFTDAGPAGPRVIMAGLAYEDDGHTTRRIRTAIVAQDGTVLNRLIHLPSDSGLVNAWATDLLTLADGTPIFSIAHQSE